MYSRAGSDVYYAVSGVHCFFVVLNNYYGVAEVAQTFKRGKQFFVVALVKSDARLVKDI